MIEMGLTWWTNHVCVPHTCCRQRLTTATAIITCFPRPPRQERVKPLPAPPVSRDWHMDTTRSLGYALIPNEGTGRARRLFDRSIRKSNDVYKHDKKAKPDMAQAGRFQNPRPAPEPFKRKDSWGSKLTRRTSSTSTSSSTKLKVTRCGKLAGLAARAAERTKQKMEGAFEQTNRANGSSDSSHQRSDSALEIEWPSGRPEKRQRGGAANSMDQGCTQIPAREKIRCPHPDPEANKQDKPRDGTCREKSSRKTTKETMTAMFEMDRLSSEQAESYKAMSRRRHRLQDHVISYLEEGGKVSLKHLQDRHNNLAVLSLEMDRLVRTMLEIQERKTELTYEFVMWQQVSPEGATKEVERQEKNGGMLKSSSRGWSSKGQAHQRYPSNTGTAEQRLAMSYSHIMDFLDESSADV